MVLCKMKASRVYPVVIRSTVCSLLLLVTVLIGEKIVLLYSSIVLVMAVYVFSSVSSNLPQCQVVRAFGILWRASLCLLCFDSVNGFEG